MRIHQQHYHTVMNPKLQEFSMKKGAKAASQPYIGYNVVECICQKGWSNHL